MHESRATETSVKLVIPSEIRLIDLVHNAAEKMATFAGFDDDDALNVGLAVREAAINAIVHGNGEDPELDVDIEITVNGDGLSATIGDRGSGFEPKSVPDPRDSSHLLDTSGRGLLLIRAFVDEVDYRRRRDRGMEITLRKRNGGRKDPGA
ncbi:MAG: ATP-binding protein [bacterium]|nr:ATP-binding protein [bacterium]